MAVMVNNMNLTLSETPLIKKKKTSKFAIASLIFGIISLTNHFFFPTLPRLLPIYSALIFSMPSIITLVFGIIAIKNISSSPNLKGIVLAIVGMVLAIPQLILGAGIYIMYILH